jgi:ribosomal protein L11 methyltransferase
MEFMENNPQQVERYFREIRFSIPEEYYDLATAIISDFPVTGIEEGLDEQRYTFHESDWSEGQIITQIEESMGQAGIPIKLLSVYRIKDKNWNQEWEQSLQPVFVNDRIAITPVWKADQVNHEITLLINPQMSFGTGYHPTTRMVCRFMGDYVKPDSAWIDAGCGSGVLAILATKLGASTVFAFDNDEWSVANSLENAALNNCQTDNPVFSREDVFTVALPACDGIAANLYRNLLLPNLPRFRQALQARENGDGILIMSGILRFDVEEILQAALQCGFIHIKTEIEGDWAAIAMKIST